MVFILYKLYVLLPYTYPTPKLSPHRRLCAFLDFQKKHHLVCFFKPFELRGHRQCPHKPPSNCNTSVIPMLLNKFCPRKPQKPVHTHTHTYWFLWFSRTLMAKQVGWWFKGTHLSQCPTEMITLSKILFYSAEHKYHFGFSLHTIEWIISHTVKKYIFSGQNIF